MMTDGKIVRFAAVLVVFAGYAFAFRGGESQIGDRVAENAHLVEQLTAGERMLASRSTLVAERTRLRARLRAVDLGADRSALVARFVRDAARIAAVRRTTIPAITASGTPAAPVPLGAVANPVAAGGNAIDGAANSGEPFDTIPLEITVEGRYTDVLATIDSLSKTRVLANVDVASLARKNADTSDATLTAALHVVLQRIVSTEQRMVSAEPAGVRARPL